MKRNTTLLLFSLFCVASLSTGCRTFLYGKNTTAETEPAPTETSLGKPKEVIVPIEKVGTPGTYQEYVIPAEGVPTESLVVETEGLKGYTGAHISAPAPVPDASVPVSKPSTVCKVPAGGSVYTVKNGDILGRIARSHGVSVRAIMEANSLKSADRIRVGQKLYIPAPSVASKKQSTSCTKTVKAKKSLPARDGFVVYTIQNGDILGRIAIRHHTTQKAIREANAGLNPDRIRVGQQLYIPVAGSKASAPVQASASVAASVPAEKPASPVKTATVAAPSIPKATPAPVQPPKPAADDESVDVLSGFDL